MTGGGGGFGTAGSRFFARRDLDAEALVAAWCRHERLPRHLHYLRDYELATRWLRPSFLKHLEITGRPARGEQVIHGFAPLRYADAREALLCADRSGQCADVCLRPDGLR